MWCAERIWDPGMPKKIAGLEMEYTLLDDSHFMAAGLAPGEVHGHYITEREGECLKIFPIDMQLRYLIPFKEPHEVIAYLLRLRDRGVRVVTYGDDGEKFGMWPGTHQWVIQQGWLRRFLEEVSRREGEIEVIPLAEALDRFSPQGRVYLPTASYQEMMEWSLFCAQGRLYEDLIDAAKADGSWELKRAFFRGGMWDNFLAKYPESNRMHKKMLYISDLMRVHDMPPEALRYLLRSQCNCAYWHGLFGGVYIRELRQAIYENLLEAEACVDARRLQARPWVLEEFDYDRDGNAEILVSGRDLNCHFAPHTNAAVFALEYKPARLSLSNILMRHAEIYHRAITEEKVPAPSGDRGDTPLSIHDITRATEGLEEMLVYDAYPRYSFMTHALTGVPVPEDILRQNHVRESLTADLDFELVRQEERGQDLVLSFVGERDALRIVKTYVYDPDGRIVLSHAITGGEDVTYVALEWNLMLPSGAPPRVDDRLLEGDRGCSTAKKVEFCDEKCHVHVVLQSESPWEVIVAPIECVSQSESGFEKTFQGWCLYWLREREKGLPDVVFSVSRGAA